MSESKTVRIEFPDVATIHPGKPNEDIEMPKQSSIRDTYFANLYRSWFKNGAFGFDSDLHDDFRNVLKDYITKTVAIKMVTEDASTSAQAVGLKMSLDKHAIEAFAQSALDIQLFSEICTIVGLHEYRDAIIMRELDKNFGTYRQLESEKRQQKRKEDDHDSWMRNTGSGIHNMLRELTIIMKKSSNQPAQAPMPVTPEILRALHQNITSRMPSGTEE